MMSHLQQEIKTKKEKSFEKYSLTLYGQSFKNSNLPLQNFLFNLSLFYSPTNSKMDLFSGAQFIYIIII
jgi:hypothetical protein